MKLYCMIDDHVLIKENLFKVKCLQYLSSNMNKHCGFHSLVGSSKKKISSGPYHVYFELM